jgi:hypothetical protein
VALAAKESELATAREAEAVAGAQAAAAVHRADEAEAALKQQQEEVGRLRQQTKLKQPVRATGFPAAQLIDKGQAPSKSLGSVLPTSDHQ